MKHAFLLFGFLLLVSARPAHALKMCVCDAKYHPDAKQLTLKFKFFWDDLEATLEKQTGRELDLTKISADNNRLLADFVRKQFELKINNSAIDLQLVRSKIQDVVLLVEFTSQILPAAKSYAIDLRNEILMDAFSDQYNIVRFDFFGDGNYETMRFERAERHLRKQAGK